MKYLMNTIKIICLMCINIIVYAQAVNSDAKMVDLPPLPKISEQLETNQASELATTMQSGVDQSEKCNKVPGYDYCMSDVAPWKDGYGDPEEQNYQTLLKQQFPMSPEQMEAFRKTLDIYEKSVQTQARSPIPVISTRNISLDTGSSPLPIRISTGYISAILFVDETGSAWPILSYAIGNPTAYNINWDGKNNALFIQGKKAYANTNMVVNLANLPTPLMINLVSDQKEVDYRLDIRVPGTGPFATAPIIKVADVAANVSDNILMELIDGIPPSRAKLLDVKGGTAQAWLLDDKELLIRTRLTILSPAYTNSMRSPDGMKVYRMPKTPLVMASKDGNTYQLKLDGY